MPDRRALIVDKDDEFTRRAGQCLQRLGFSIDVIARRREALTYVESHAPDIVLLAVERPKKSGFALFSDFKRRLKQIPIILVTSTVSAEELLLHQKLRLHADAYLDKRDLTEIELLKTLDRLLQLGYEEAELMSIADALTRDLTPIDSSADAELRALDSELAALLVETSPDPPATAIRRDDPDNDEDDSLEDSTHRFTDDHPHELRRQLEAAQRAASSSPFSSDYLKLSDRADRVEREVVRLRDSAAKRGHQVHTLRSKLVETASRLLESESKRDRYVERVRRLEERLAGVQRDIERRIEQERGRWESEREDHEAQLAEQREELLRQGSEAAAARDAEWQKLLKDQQRRHEQLLASRDEQLKNESAELRRTLAEDLARKEQEFEERLRRREDAHRQEVSSECGTWKRRLEDEKDRRRSELAALESSHRKQLEALEAQRRRTVDDVGRSHEAERDRLRTEQEKAWRKKLEEALAAYARARAEQSRDHEREIARLTAEHEQVLRGAERQRKAAVARAVAETRRELSRDTDESTSRLHEAKERHLLQVTELKRQHTEEIAALKQSHKDEIERLRAHLEKERERLRMERNAALDEFADKLRRDQQETLRVRQAEWEAKLVELARGHDRTVASHREEIRMLSEALDATRGEKAEKPEDQRESDVPATDVEVAEIETPRSRLRRLVAELDSVEPQPAGSSAQRNND